MLSKFTWHTFKYCKNDIPVHENGCFRGRDAVFEAVIHEKWQNRGREGGRQKRDTLERMSL